VRKVQHTNRNRGIKIAASLAIVAMFATACGGGDKDNGGSSNGGGTPVAGGVITYGVEGKTTQFCPPKTQAAISGIMIMQSMYDTLAEPTNDGRAVPYLAKTITPNDDSSVWTIGLREGVTFHDGTPVDAAAVAQNITAWTKGLLLQFVFSNIATVTVTDPLTVTVAMKKPWVAFPWYLWTTGRTGIAAPAQLDSPDCDTKLIGSGPFKLKSFDPASGDVSVVKNASYWRKGYPLLDGINWKVQGDSIQRMNGLEGGQFDVIHTSGGKDRKTVESFGANITAEPAGNREISQVLINLTRPPFNDPNARLALALSQDRDALAAIGAGPGTTKAYQVVDSKVLGHIKDPAGYPKGQDIPKAKKLVAEYKAAHGGKFELNLQSTFDPTTQALAAEIKREAAIVGITVNLPAPVDQAAIINQALGGAVDAFAWRNYPGADPDTLYVWFHSGSPVNFGKINDPIIDKALDDGRSELDPAKRKVAYETFVSQMSSEITTLWGWYTNWFIGSNDKVTGILGPNLPDESGKPGKDKPAAVFAGYHQLLGISKTK
jgi:peptide/nickel transport system substrate-binding protein